MSQSGRTRRRFTPEQKAAILCEHLVDGRPVRDVCERHKVHPTLFYRWRKEFLEKAHVVFERDRPDAALRKAGKKIARLEQKLRRRDEVLVELMTEHIAVKKDSWGRLRGKWVEPDIRDRVVDFVIRWNRRTGLPVRFFAERLDISQSKYFDWKKRYGQPNRHTP